jgi:signal transduction histidine kinase
MSSSLRSRLWLSYAFLIVTALSIVAVILFITLLRNPLLYRQTLERLRAVQTILMEREKTEVGQDLWIIAKPLSQTFNVRILHYSRDGQILSDTSAGKEPELPFPQKRWLARNIPVVRDVNGKAWIYSQERLSYGTYVVIAAERPRITIANIFTDDFLLPIFQSGLVALVLSLIVAFLFARWVADPLQKVVLAARVLPSDKIIPVEVQGPHEVQELMRAFNAMVSRMQASQKSQRDFVANVSHELKTPLTSIQGFSQAILDGTAQTDTDRRQAAQVIHDESGRMHRLVLDLLDLARLDSGTADITMSQVNIQALLKAVAEKFAPQSQAANVQIRLSIESDLPTILADGDRLSQVFTNLVDNALKFTPQGGSIDLQASVTKGEMRVSVIDHGLGMTPEVRAHVFERFYQADASRSRQERHGAGLGLAIAHEIVQAHGGRINVRSVPGEGTVFEVFLPLTKK